MKPKQRLIIFIYHFGSGIMQPVMALMLIAHGCTLQTLPLALAAYGIVALCLELPSGVYADRNGRKRTFLMAIMFHCCSFAMLIFSRGFVTVAFGMMLHGVARAFASGSLDALVIDDFLEREGEGELHRVTSQMSVTIGCGISAGALCGGFLPSAGGYVTHLILRTALLAAVGIMTVLWIPRDMPIPKVSELPISTPGITGIHFTLPLLCMLGSVGGLTAIMSQVETYWLPAIKALAPASANGLLGVLSATSFFLLTLGSVAMGRLKIKSKQGRWNVYFAMQIMLCVIVMILARQKTLVGFGAAYLIFYLVIGADDVQEQTLLNGLADSGNRAATISASSLAGQLGGFVASAYGAMTVVGLGINGMWQLLGGAVAVVFAILWLATLLSRKNL